MVRQGKGDGGVLSSTGIDDYLPNQTIIPKPGKLAGMIWIREVLSYNLPLPDELGSGPLASTGGQTLAAAPPPAPPTAL